MMTKISTKNITTSKLNFNKNISIGRPNNDVINVSIPGVLDNMIYLDNSYLVIAEDKNINCYKFDNKEDEVEIYLKENLMTKFDGKQVDIEDLPDRIRSEVVKGEI